MTQDLTDQQLRMWAVQQAAGGTERVADTMARVQAFYEFAKAAYGPFSTATYIAGTDTAYGPGDTVSGSTHTSDAA